MIDKVVALTTCSSPAEAEKIARALVEKRFAACVNIVPGLRSIYRWQGAVEDAAEHLLVIKTTREQFQAVRRELESLHSYELPELIALPIVEGSDRYLDWIARQVGPDI